MPLKQCTKHMINIKNTFASMLYGGIKSEIFYSKARKYESALYASLFQDNISVDVYNNLIKSVHENLDTLNRYVDIREKVFKFR